LPLQAPGERPDQTSAMWAMLFGNILGPVNLTFAIRMNWHNRILLSPGSDICQRADTVFGQPVKRKAQVSSRIL
jgi:hypothetical protein